MHSMYLCLHDDMHACSLCRLACHSSNVTHVAMLVGSQRLISIADNLRDCAGARSRNSSLQAGCRAARLSMDIQAGLGCRLLLLSPCQGLFPGAVARTMRCTALEHWCCVPCFESQCVAQCAVPAVAGYSKKACVCSHGICRQAICMQLCR